MTEEAFSAVGVSLQFADSAVELRPTGRTVALAVQITEVMTLTAPDNALKPALEDYNIAIRLNPTNSRDLPNRAGFYLTIWRVDVSCLILL